MIVEERAWEIEKELDALEYELKIAVMNNRLSDAIDLEHEMIDLENELMALGY